MVKIRAIHPTVGITSPPPTGPGLVQPIFSAPPRSCDPGVSGLCPCGAAPRIVYMHSKKPLPCWISHSPPTYMTGAPMALNSLLSQDLHSGLLTSIRISCWSQPNSLISERSRPRPPARHDSATLVDISAFGGNAPDDILGSQYRRHFTATRPRVLATDASFRVRRL